MALLDRFNKQPRENKRYQIKYTEWLGEGETITQVLPSVTLLNSASSDDVNEPTLTIDTTSIILSGTYYQYFVSSGTSGKRYKVTFLSETSDTQVLESEIEFTVSDT